MATLPKYVGLDVGGMTMKAAVVDDAGKAFPPAVMDTNTADGQDAGLETMCETIRRAVAKAGLTMGDIAAIGVATPGLGDIRAGVIIDPPNLKPWKDVPVRDHIAKAFGKPTAYQNDANAAAVGEFWVGAGRGTRSMVMFTLGTGVGGGIIVDGNVLEGEHSHGGELGHLRIDLPDRGRLCGCGARGCLEAYASATAVTKRAREESAAWRGPTALKRYQTLPDGAALSEQEKKKQDGNYLDPAVIFDLAEKGDDCARKVVDDTAFYLAMGACAVIATVDPQVIVFGGGMAVADWFRATIAEYVVRYGLPYPVAKSAAPVRIAFAELGSDAGFIGAAACARMLPKGKG